MCVGVGVGVARQAAKLFVFKGVSFHDNVTQPRDVAPEAPHIVSFIATTTALALVVVLGAYRLYNTYSAQIGDVIHGLYP